ncbi:MAG: hypothetical protein AAGH15_28275 [Myxococcota bacterium]
MKKRPLGGPATPAALVPAAPASPGKPARSLADLRRSEEGVAYAEYVTIVLLVGIGVSAALIGVGIPLLRAYRLTQIFLGAPVP